MDKEYKCKRCGSTMSCKQAIFRHLNRKKTCEPVLQDIEVSVLIDEIVGKKKTVEKKYECNVCHKTFAYLNNMYSHRKNCSIKKETIVPEPKGNDPEDENSLKAEVKQLREQLMKFMALQQQQPSATYNTTNTTNIQIVNNIQQNSFGKEQLDHITKPFLRNCLLKTNEGITELLKEVHFSDSAPPENNNIRVKNFGKRNNFVEIIDEKGNWVVADKDRMLHAMFRNGYKILWECFMDTQRNNDKEVIEREEALNAWFAEIGSTTSKSYYKVKRDLYVLIYNNTMYVLEKTKSIGDKE
jgi:hypothetical protein